MKETLLRKDRFKPSIAVPISVTVKMPMTMPKVVSIERILLARMALQEMSKPSRSSVNGFTLREAPSSKQRPLGWDLVLGASLDVGCWSLELFYSHQYRLLDDFADPFITRNQAISNANDPPRMPGDIFLVGHHNDRIALLRQFS